MMLLTLLITCEETVYDDDVSANAGIYGPDEYDDFLANRVTRNDFLVSSEVSSPADLIPSENADVDIPDLPLLGASSDRDLIFDQPSSLLSFEAPIFSPIQLQV